MRTKSQKSSKAKTERPKRAKISAQESLKRMREFSKRKAEFIAAIRKGKEQSAFRLTCPVALLNLR